MVFGIWLGILQRNIRAHPKLVVVNSHGPMGASVLGALLEKIGVSGNMPLREVGLTDYVFAPDLWRSGFMEKKTLAQIKALDKGTRIGGIHVRSRKNLPLEKRAAIERVAADLSELAEVGALDLADRYFRCKQTMAKSLIYKKANEPAEWHIEFGTDLLGYDGAKLAEKFDHYFPGVRFITLEREFEDWIGSMALQAYRKDTWQRRWGFFSPVGLAQRYHAYAKTAAELPGLKIEFEDLLADPERVLKNTADFLGIQTEIPDLKSENFDVWSKSLSFEETFTPYDRANPLLSKSTRKFCRKILEKVGPRQPVAERVGKMMFMKDAALWALKKS